MNFCSLLVHGNDFHTTFLSHLKKLEFQKAKELTSTQSDELLKAACLNLSQVLFDAGQKNKLDLEEPKTIKGIVDAYNYLAFGFQNLYTENKNTLSFRLFRDVYEFAQKTKNIELEKFAIISILEVYSEELVQVNDSPQSYLEKLRLLKSTEIDNYYYYLNVLNFNLREVSYIIRVDDIFLAKFHNLMSKFPKKSQLFSQYYSSLGVYYETQNKYVLAEQFHKNALARRFASPFLKFVRFRSYLHLAEIQRTYYRDYKLAKTYIDSASQNVNSAKPIRSKHHLDYYYARTYKDWGNYKIAFEYLRSSDSLAGRLAYQKSSSEISRLNLKYQTAKKERQILLEQQKARKNKNWLTASITLLIFGGLTAFLLQKNTTKKRKLAEQQTQLEQQKVATLLKDQELTAIDAMISGQEKERQRVANELHDDLGSLMATVKLHFDNIKGDKQDPALKSASKLLEKAYQKIRGIAHSKNSGLMADQGLLLAVQKMARTISETNILKITVEDFGLKERMENSLELTIFRIVQELIANTIKHSGASKASIQFTQHEDKLNIIVEDNGQGFDMAKVSRTSKGMGLGTIEKRIEHLEGSFTVDSILGKGTSILIDIPI